MIDMGMDKMALSALELSKLSTLIERLTRICAILSLAVGCSGQPATTPISGTVEFNSQPIQSGEIRFVTVGSNPGKIAGGPISQGKYELSGQNQLRAGTYRIEVYGYRNLDNSNAPIDPTRAESNYVQFLPEKWNTQSELSVEVTGKDQSLTRDFALN